MSHLHMRFYIRFYTSFIHVATPFLQFWWDFHYIFSAYFFHMASIYYNVFFRLCNDAIRIIERKTHQYKHYLCIWPTKQNFTDCDELTHPIKWFLTIKNLHQKKYLNIIGISGSLDNLTKRNQNCANSSSLCETCEDS